MDERVSINSFMGCFILRRRWNHTRGHWYGVISYRRHLSYDSIHVNQKEPLTKKGFRLIMKKEVRPMPNWLTVILFNLATCIFIVICWYLILNYAAYLQIGLFIVVVAIAVIVVIGGTVSMNVSNYFATKTRENK